MGMNYYTPARSKCETCGYEPEKLHIGKSSIGWKFVFAPYPNLGLTTASAWRDYLKTRPIEDEEGRPHAYDNFWELVDIKQADPATHTLSSYYEMLPPQGRLFNVNEHERIDPQGHPFATTADFL